MINQEKYRRMALRRRNGTREVKAIMARPFHRGPTYLIAHACFPCRKSFKRIRMESVNKHKCPDCAGPAYEMGRSFTAPKKTDIRQWKKVYYLYSAGFRFIGNGFHDAKQLPSNLGDLADFLECNKEHHLKIAQPNNSITFSR